MKRVEIGERLGPLYDGADCRDGCNGSVPDMAPATPNKLPSIPTPVSERLNVRAFVAPLRMVCFWLAVVLPFAHLSLLASGISSPAETQAFLVLLGLNLATLVVGHGHHHDD